jgi:hypothetical protein
LTDNDNRAAEAALVILHVQELRRKLEHAKEEALQLEHALADMVFQHCSGHGGIERSDAGVFCDAGFISANAHAIRALADRGRFKIQGSRSGRGVSGHLTDAV